MNKLYFFALLTFFTFMSFDSKSQTVNGVEYDQLILGVTNISEKNFDDLKNNITTIPGVILKYYCTEHNCFLMLVDSDKQPDYNSVVSTLSNKFPKLKFHIKEGEFSDVTNNCDSLIPFINTVDATQSR